MPNTLDIIANLTEDELLRLSRLFEANSNRLLEVMLPTGKTLGDSTSEEVMALSERCQELGEV